MPLRSVPPALAGLVAGLVLGTVGAFWIPLRVAGVRLPLSALLVPLLVVVACRAVGLLTGSRLAAAAPSLGWAASVALLSTRGPGGDVVVPGGDLVGTAYLLLGTTGAAVGAVLGVPVPRVGGGPARPATTSVTSARKVAPPRADTSRRGPLPSRSGSARDDG